MLFTSYEFIFFIAVLLGLYYVIPKKFQWILLLVASFFFYWVANPAYLLFIGVTIVTVYLATRIIENNADRQAVPRVIAHAFSSSAGASSADARSFLYFSLSSAFCRMISADRVSITPLRLAPRVSVSLR